MGKTIPKPGTTAGATSDGASIYGRTERTTRNVVCYRNVRTKGGLRSMTTGTPVVRHEAQIAGSAALLQVPGVAQGNEPWQLLYRYWLSKRIGERPPSRQDIDPPIDIPRLVKNLMLMDVTPEGYRYRVLGSEVEERHGLYMTGQLFGSSGIDPKALADLRRAIDEVVVSQNPRILNAEIDPAMSARNTMLILPLVSADGQTSHIVIGSFYDGHFAPETRRLGMVPAEF